MAAFHGNRVPAGLISKLHTACDCCRTLKIKCDGKAPCSRCDRRNTKCLYSLQHKAGPRPRSEAAPPFAPDKNGKAMMCLLAQRVSEAEGEVARRRGQGGNSNELKDTKRLAAEEEEGEVITQGGGKTKKHKQSPAEALSAAYSDVAALFSNAAANMPAQASQVHIKHYNQNTLHLLPPLTDLDAGYRPPALKKVATMWQQPKVMTAGAEQPQQQDQDKQQQQYYEEQAGVQGHDEQQLFYEQHQHQHQHQHQRQQYGYYNEPPYGGGGAGGGGACDPAMESSRQRRQGELSQASIEVVHADVLMVASKCLAWPV